MVWVKSNRYHKAIPALITLSLMGLASPNSTFANCNLIFKTSVAKKTRVDDQWYGRKLNYDYEGLLRKIMPTIVAKVKSAGYLGDSEALDYVIWKVNDLIARLEDGTGPPHMYETIPYNLIGHLLKTFIPQRIGDFSKKPARRVRTGWSESDGTREENSRPNYHRSRCRPGRP